MNKFVYFYRKTIELFRQLSERNKVLILSVLVSVTAAIAAIVLKSAVHFTQQTLENAFPDSQFNYLYLAFPIIGIILTVLFVKLFIKDDLSHGVSKILYAMSSTGGRLKSHHTYSSIVASTLTVGFGGSVGLEAPITLTGSAMGSQLGKFFNLSERSVILLVACGATAAVSAIFNAPIAGVIFAIEVLMLDFTTASLLPLLISATVAASMSFLILGRTIMFSTPVMPTFEMQNLPLYILLGFVTGLYSLYYIRVAGKIEKFFSRIKHTFVKILLGGVALSVLIFFFPSFFGEGYNTIAALMHDNISELFSNSPLFYFRYNRWLLIAFLFMLLIFKTFATALTTGAGGIGGVFAPALFLGAIAGSLLAILLNTLFGWELSVLNFTLAGMAGVMGSIMQAPLTAVFLIAEISGGYQLFVPIIITVVPAYLLFHRFEKYSVYTKSLAASGDLITHDKDKRAMRQLNVKTLIEKDFLTLKPEDKLRDLVNTIANSTRNIFPIVDEDEHFFGIVIMDDVRKIIFEPQKYDTVMVKNLAFMPTVSIHPEESIFEVAEKFKSNDLYNMVVLDENNKYYGFISRANLFSAYRHAVEAISED
ncbi:MAG: chloride channel protein [Bacteroidales bacterium]|jgi:CIC family chloride channel protein|nr:chloride channel protein [Bacteroidales bacterium]